MPAPRRIRLELPAEGQRPEQLYTIREVATILSVSRRTVFRLLSCGELDAVNTGSLTRIPASELAAYQERNRRSVRKAGAELEPVASGAE